MGVTVVAGGVCWYDWGRADGILRQLDGIDFLF